MKLFLRIILALAGGLAVLWVVGLIYFDGPFRPPGSTANLLLAIVWASVLVVGFIKLQDTDKRFVLIVLMLAMVLIPWSFIKPSNTRDWKPEFAETGRVEVVGDTLTFHKVRNFDYSPDGRVTQRWETRVHHLSNLRAVDYCHVAFGGDLLAHPLLSFDFGPEGHLALSIETRREADEDFSALGGLYKMFELQYLFGSESDLIRLRTNIRNEPAYLYRLRIGPAKAREILLESITTQNDLHDDPRLYNVITANCTTSFRAQTPADERARLDIRMLLNGLLDELVHEKGAIADDGLSFEELRPRAKINPAAEAAHDSSDFSAAIRAGRPGFE